MRNFFAFMLISVALHVLLLLIELPEPKQSQTPAPTPIDIVKKEPVAAPIPPTPAPTPAERPPTRPTPQPMPVPNPEPLEDQEPSEGPKPPEDNVIPIIPREYSAENPPRPMGLADFLREQQTQEERGPNRPVERIVRDFLDEQTMPPGEDKVSFNSLNMKYESYFYRFARAIYGLWKYPTEAAMRGESGIVRVTFSITKEGKLTNIRMLESSGYPALDREVMRVLRNMPEMPLPESFGLNVLHVNGFFIYSLTGEYRLY